MRKINTLILDFEGILCANQNRSGEMDITIPPVEGAFEAVKMAVKKVGFENVHILSKCSIEAEQFIHDWLVSHKFYGKTGFFDPKHNIHFCRERREKAHLANVISGPNEYVMVDNSYTGVLENFKNPHASLLLVNPSVSEYSSFVSAQGAKDPVAMRIFYEPTWATAHGILETLLR